MDLKINLPGPVVVFDTETGGLNGDFEINWTKKNDVGVNQLVEGKVTKRPAPILEIGAVILSPNSLDEVSSFHTLCGPEEGQSIESFMGDCTDRALSVNGFGSRIEELEKAPPMSVAIKNFLNFLPKRYMIAGQNLRYDMHMIEAACSRFGINMYNNSQSFEFKQSPLELVTFATFYFALGDTPIVANYKLTTIAEALGISTDNAHSALADVRMTSACLKKILSRFSA